MWLPLWLAVALWSISGCTYSYTHSLPLAPEQYGTAADCDWDTGAPLNCVRDPTRATIDVDRLNSLLDRVQRCHDDELTRRRL